MPIIVSVDREKVVQAAQKLIIKGRLDRAISEYQKLVKANPGDDRAMIKIAELQTRMRAYDAAVATYEQVAAYYSSQGFSAKAMAIYKQIRGLIQQHLPESKGHYGPVVDKLAELYVKAGLKGDAVATYEEYAVHLHRVSRDEELLPVYRRIVELKEEDLDARVRLIDALRADGQDKDADDHLVEYGERLVGQGRIDEGLVALDRVALKRKDDAVLARRVADLYLDRNGPGDPMLAMQRMQVCFMSTQRDIETLRVLARAFTTVGQRPKAIEVRKLMVKIAWDKGDTEIAQALVDELLEDCPRETAIMEIASMVYPDRSFARPVPMPQDAPEVEAAPASIDLSEESFELIEDSVIDLGEEALEAASSYPAPPPEFGHDEGLPSARSYELDGFGMSPSPRPLAPPPPPRLSTSPARPYEANPLPPRPTPPPRPSPPLPPVAPPPFASGDAGFDPPRSASSLDAEYDALVPDVDEPEEETTLARRRSDLLPDSFPPADLLNDADEPFGDLQGGAGPVEPEYEVDEGLEEALEEADFFATQELFEDALAVLEELIPRYPGHPLLVQRMQSVRAAMRGQSEDNG